MVKKIVAGVIGAGRIGKMHIQNILSYMPDIDLKSVADHNLDETWASDLGIRVRSRDASDVIGDEEIDAVLIVTSSTAHVELIQASARAGKQIFCEKPIAFEPERINEAIQAVKSAGVIL